MGFGVGGAIGGMFGTFEMLGVKGAAYDQRIGHIGGTILFELEISIVLVISISTGNRILGFGGVFSLFLAAGMAFSCARDSRF